MSRKIGQAIGYRFVRPKLTAPTGSRVRLAIACLVLALTAGAAAHAAGTPAIRLSASNQVPGCVTPDRLMAFLATRNSNLIPRFSTIASWYARHGEAWRVRWDYAFFQMLIETNFLTYRQPNGRWGDVDPKQNNFAGLGTTGGGVPGDSYPDVSTGVLAQIQHLVAYSGELLDDPVGARTRLKQDVIVKASAPIAERRPVTFQDLSGRWAVDRKYGRSIAWVASLYEKRFCPEGFANSPPRRQTAATSRDASATPRLRETARRAQGDRQRLDGLATAVAGLGKPTRPAAQPARPTTCRVSIASFGGSQTVLIEAIDGTELQLTALDVDPANAREMTSGFIAQYAQGGSAVSTYDNRQLALAEAYRRCPAAAAPVSR